MMMMFNQDTPLKLRLGAKEPFQSDVFIPLPIPSHPSILKLNPTFSIPSNPDFQRPTGSTHGNRNSHLIPVVMIRSSG
jgi:hypothetical protein